MLTKYSNLSAAALFQQAIAMHQLGCFEEAEPLYRQILLRQPEHADANHNLASLLAEQGALEAALPFYARACGAKPDNTVYAESYLEALSQLALAATCAQFPILFAAQDFAQCELIAQDLLTRHGDCAVAWKYWGAALLIQGKPCIDPLQTAAKYLPNDSGVWSNLGAAFHHLGQPEPAISYCLHALKLNAQCFEAHLNLGLIYQKTNAFELAVESYQAVLKHDPNLVAALSAISVCYKELGDFSQCHHFAQRTISAWLMHQRTGDSHVKKISRAVDSAPKVMCVESAHKALQALRQRLDSVGIEWCLYAGSCLGVFRDGDLLPYDKDIDIAVHADVPRQKLIALLTADDCFKLIPQSGLNKLVDNQYSIAFYHVAQNIGVDIFFLHRDGEQHYISGFEHPGQAVKCRLCRFEFGAHSWVNGSYLECPMPIPTAQYLCDVYGLNWRTPDPYYDTVLSNPSRMAESLPVALCYGYCRLVEKLLRQNWPAAASYCAQLLARVDDPLLVELQSFLPSLERKT